MSDHLPISRRAMAAPPYFQGLNPEQREAVEALDGPVLVLAGAGTGKTRVLTTRLAHLLATGRAKPWQVLAVTFTNKASREMRERVEKLLGPGSGGLPWLGTFHSISALMLRRHAELAGLKSSFTILDTDDQLRLMKQIIAAENIDEKRWPARALAGLIDGWKNKALAPASVPKEDAHAWGDGKAIRAYAAYQERLRILNACDFGDLLMHMIHVFQKLPDLLAEYHKKLTYLMVDEYQDTNVAQYMWLRLLAQGSKNLCVVGDDDQCVAAGSLVTMADGSQRPIETIKVGDFVRSGYGSGDFRAARVVATHENMAPRSGVRLTTQGGRTLVTTREHVHFAGYRLGTTPQMHFVYLMHKRGVGFRVGVTQVYTRGQVKPMPGFAQRLLQEHADALWILSTHADEQSARAEEYLTSLKYGLPTIPFVPRKGKGTKGLVHDAAQIARVFAELDTEAAALRVLERHGLSLSHPHHRPRSRNANRRNVVVTLCGDRRGATPMHRLSIVGNDAEGRAMLAGLGFSVRAAKQGSSSWRVETAAKDYGAVATHVQTIAEATQINVFRNARLGRQASEEQTESNSLPFTPAAYVRPGMAVFDGNGDYDVIASVEHVSINGPVYDLNIEGTHNFVVGDLCTHNSIYGWRGAEVDNILRFERDFPGAKVVRLERNYRSTGNILASASGLIAHNKDRLGKTLWTEDAPGDRVRVRGVWDGEAEARLVAEDIEAWVSQSTPPPARGRPGGGPPAADSPRANRSAGADPLRTSPLQGEESAAAEFSRRRRHADCAVLVRAAWQMRAFEERFNMMRIPYKVVGGPRFFERAEIRDAHAYLRLIRSEDDDLAFERIINQPKRGFGDTSLAKLHALTRRAPAELISYDAPLFDAATGEIVDSEPPVSGHYRTLMAAARHAIRAEELPLKARATLSAFVRDLERWTAMARDMRHVELAEIVLDESGYTDMLKNDKSPTAQTRLENLKELVGNMGQFDSLAAYLEHVELVLDIEREGDGDEVHLSTLHAAKGLEWPLVFLPGWEEMVFPSQRSVDESGLRGLEEERRLAYVGVTRARESARISFVANRQIHGRWQSVLPSRFVDELPEAHVDAISETGYGAGGVHETPLSFGGSPGAGFGSSYPSPGWKRAQDRTSEGRPLSRPPLIEGEARLVAKSGGADVTFNVGARVFHDKFGYGRVRSVEGNKLTVDFEHSGEKKVIDSFVKAG